MLSVTPIESNFIGISIEPFIQFMGVDWISVIRNYYYALESSSRLLL